MSALLGKDLRNGDTMSDTESEQRAWEVASVVFGVGVGGVATFFARQNCPPLQKIPSSKQWICTLGDVNDTLLSLFVALVVGLIVLAFWEGHFAWKRMSRPSS